MLNLSVLTKIIIIELNSKHIIWKDSHYRSENEKVLEFCYHVTCVSSMYQVDDVIITLFSTGNQFSAPKIKKFKCQSSKLYHPHYYDRPRAHISGHLATVSTKLNVFTWIIYSEICISYYTISQAICTIPLIKKQLVNLMHQLHLRKHALSNFD